jgi:hypothetical protein
MIATLAHAVVQVAVHAAQVLAFVLPAGASPPPI